MKLIFLILITVQFSFPCYGQNKEDDSLTIFNKAMAKYIVANVKEKKTKAEIIEVLVPWEKRENKQIILANMNRTTKAPKFRKKGDLTVISIGEFKIKVRLKEAGNYTFEINGSLFQDEPLKSARYRHQKLLKFLTLNLNKKEASTTGFSLLPKAHALVPLLLLGALSGPVLVYLGVTAFKSAKCLNTNSSVVFKDKKGKDKKVEGCVVKAKNKNGYQGFAGTIEANEEFWRMKFDGKLREAPKLPSSK